MTPAAMGMAAVALFAGWTFVGARQLGRTAMVRLAREQRRAALWGLLPCLVLTGLVAYAGLPPLAAALAAAAAFCAHAALEPRRASFWHHRRIRPLGVLAAAALAAGLAELLPWPELAPAVLGVAVFTAHLAGRAGLAIDAQGELSALREKIVSMETKRRLLPFFHEGEAVEAKRHANPGTPD